MKELRFASESVGKHWNETKRINWWRNKRVIGKGFSERTWKTWMNLQYKAVKLIAQAGVTAMKLHM